MGLDAYVFCDCYEMGKLREPPPAGILLQLDASGDLGGDISGLPMDTVIAFDRWRDSSACEHRAGILLRHRLGNISLIALLRCELSREPERFPVLLERVIYDGMHAGDHVPVEILPALEQEVAQLHDFRCSRKGVTQYIQGRWPNFGRGRRFRLPSTKADAFMQGFCAQMEELIAAAKQVRKPIAF